jgi:hypothetical protein
MIRDVFYFNKKPNVHPREKHADNLAHARAQSTTEHFWIINEFCEYRNFDWDWDFEFLHDEDVWAEEHNNVWPSYHQKDSGTWLCSTEFSDVVIYRADVDPLARKNEQSEFWNIIQEIDTTKFDFSWHPETGPAFIYVWGNKWHPVELEPVIEYHVPGATERKYMSDVVEVLPQADRWKEIQSIDHTKFDFSWRPDPREPAFIYVWGNKFNPVELETALEYHCPGATEIKYMTDVVEVLPETDRWAEVQPVDKSSFDFSWRPDPREPPYIYQFGTQHQKTGGPRYTVPGATDVKYIATFKAVALPDKTNWTIPDNIDVTAFDFSWHPDDTSSENYIYCFSTQWALSGGPRYSEPGAVQKKYIEIITSIALPSKENWEIPDNIDVDTFDFSWHPYAEDDPYIYQFGTQHQKTGGPRYITPGADENSAIKYIDTRIIKATAVAHNKSPNWVIIDDMIVHDFDFSWHPDDTDDDYIHVFGNQWNPAEVEPTIEYHVTGATQRKYVNSQIVVLKGNPERFTNTEFIIEFDYSWRPNPKDTAYIHQFGTQWGISGGPRLTAAGATEIKYVEYPVSKIKVNKTNWIIPSNLDISDFDFSWHPHVEDKPYIYQFGTQWAKTGGPSYIVPGATEVKYIDILKAEMLPDISLWVVPSNLAKDSFDFSWHPDSTDSPFIYQFSTQWALSGGPKLIVGNATEVKYVE